MVLVYLLGALDLACAGILIASALGYTIPQVQAPLAAALAFKGIIFFGSFASRIDIICAIVMITLLWMSAPAIAALIATYLVIKGLSSFA